MTIFVCRFVLPVESNFLRHIILVSQYTLARFLTAHIVDILEDLKRKTYRLIGFNDKIE